MKLDITLGSDRHFLSGFGILIECDPDSGEIKYCCPNDDATLSPVLGFTREFWRPASVGYCLKLSPRGKCVFCQIDEGGSYI